MGERKNRQMENIQGTIRKQMTYASQSWRAEWKIRYLSDLGEVRMKWCLVKIYTDAIG